MFLYFLINPVIPNAPFLYPLKTENRKVFWYFQEIEKGCIGNEWVNQYAFLKVFQFEPTHQAVSVLSACKIFMKYCKRDQYT